MIRTGTDPISSGPLVREAAAGHLAECLAILADSILGHYFEPDLARSLLTGALDQGELFVALDDGAVEGFYVNARRGSFLVFPYLHLLAVRTVHRGRGLGTLLLAHLEKTTLEAPGYPFRPKVFLLVAQDNPRAIEFYRRHGYSKIAGIDDMFGDGDTEFLLMKDLGKKPGSS